jgi:hypothetical protein
MGDSLKFQHWNTPAFPIKGSKGYLECTLACK